MCMILYSLCRIQSHKLQLHQHPKHPEIKEKFGMIYIPPTDGKTVWRWKKNMQWIPNEGNYTFVNKVNTNVQLVDIFVTHY